MDKPKGVDTRDINQSGSLLQLSTTDFYFRLTESDYGGWPQKSLVLTSSHGNSHIAAP